MSSIPDMKLSNELNFRMQGGFSSCLLGEKVRYDSDHKRNAYINTVLSQYIEYKSFCPEGAIGLGKPRETIRLVTIDEQIRCIGTSTHTLDVTEKLYQSADDQKHWHKQFLGCNVQFHLIEAMAN